MPKGYKTINVGDPLYGDLTKLAGKVAKREGLSKVSLASLIERMKKVYEDNVKLWVVQKKAPNKHIRPYLKSTAMIFIAL